MPKQLTDLVISGQRVRIGAMVTRRADKVIATASPASALAMVQNPAFTGTILPEFRCRKPIASVFRSHDPDTRRRQDDVQTEPSGRRASHGPALLGVWKRSQPSGSRPAGERTGASCQPSAASLMLTFFDPS